MTLAVPGATGFVALAQRAVIGKHVRSRFVDRPPPIASDDNRSRVHLRTRLL